MRKQYTLIGSVSMDAEGFDRDFTPSRADLDQHEDDQDRQSQFDVETRRNEDAPTAGPQRA